jgi:hypothetical protein
MRIIGNNGCDFVQDSSQRGSVKKTVDVLMTARKRAERDPLQE